MAGDNGKIIGVPPDGAPPVLNENPQEQKPKDLVLKITVFAATGQLEVNGPGNGQFYDEPMCFYLLEKAMDWIKAANARAAQPKIVQQSGGILNFARKGFRK